MMVERLLSFFGIAILSLLLTSKSNCPKKTVSDSDFGEFLNKQI